MTDAQKAEILALAKSHPRMVARALVDVLALGLKSPDMAVRLRCAETLLNVAVYAK